MGRGTERKNEKKNAGANGELKHEACEKHA